MKFSTVRSGALFSSYYYYHYYVYMPLASYYCLCSIAYRSFARRKFCMLHTCYLRIGRVFLVAGTSVPMESGSAASVDTARLDLTFCEFDNGNFQRQG